ncbi:E3 ubiquitin-protein ligase TRIM33-like isoform X2 [Liolophura sinensis]
MHSVCFADDTPTPRSSTDDDMAMKRKEAPSPPPTLRHSSLHSSRHSLVLDEETFEEAFLRCAICRDRYESAEKVPKLLPCHHTFCLPCLTQMVRTEGEHRQSYSPLFRQLQNPVTIHCPSCRSGFLATEENLKQLATDYRVVQLMDFLKRTNRFKVNLCSKHHLQALNFFCETCIVPVCRDCTVIDHKEYKGHIVMDMEEALKKYVPTIDTTIDALEHEVATMQDRRLILENATKELEESRHTLFLNVEQSFATLRTCMEEREKEILELCDLVVDKEKEKIADKLNLISEREDKLLAKGKHLRESKGADDVEQMFRGQQDVRKFLSTPTVGLSSRDPAEEGLQTTFKFHNLELNNIILRLNNFGDITAKTEVNSRRGGTRGERFKSV